MGGGGRAAGLAGGGGLSADKPGAGGSGGGSVSDLFSAGSRAVPIAPSVVPLSFGVFVCHESVDARACVLVGEWMCIVRACIAVC